MPTPNRSLQGQAIPIAGLVFSESESCPVPEDYIGFWLDTSGNLNLRAPDGSDSVVPRSAAAPTTAQTPNAAPVTIAAVAIPVGKCLTIEAQLTGLKADGSAGAGYTVRGTFRNQGGALAQVGATAIDYIQEDDNTWGDPSLAIDGTSVLVKVAGKAATTINWTCATSVFGK